MKLAIISDIHDNLANLKKCLRWCRAERVEALLCCGDVTNSETLTAVEENFSGLIYLVRGNIDFWKDEEVTVSKRIGYLGEAGTVELGGKKIGLCHKPGQLDNLIAAEHPDIVFFGHTHKPWEEIKSGVRVANPGTLGGVFQKATFAVYDTASGDLELKILELLDDEKRTEKN